LLQLTNPLWLFAIAALAIPVVIHLWNIKPGKTLKVGSIALMGAASRKSSRSFNLLDILLFILRCVFLLVLALLLSQPFWNKTAEAEKLKGWVLIPRQNIHQVYSSFKTKIDSLNKAGYQIRYFNRGFAAIDTAKLKNLADSAKGNPVEDWMLFKRLSSVVPSNLPLYVFTPNNLNGFGGNKPTLNLNIRIQTFILADSTKKWVSDAIMSSTSGVLKLTEGTSSPTGTTFSSSAVQQTDQRTSRYQISTNNGQLSVAFKNDSTNKVVDTTTLRIVIYSDKGMDAGYLKAALNAIKQFTNRRIDIQVINSSIIAKGKIDWVFWLRDRRISLIAAEGIENVFVYQPGKLQNIQSTIHISGVAATALTKHIPSTPSAQDQIIWQDGFGEPVLSKDDHHVYHFYSRFDPMWNDLVWSDQFPKAILTLLFDGSQNTDRNNDKRVLADEQLTPVLTTEQAKTNSNKITSQVDLSKAFWIALVLLFIMERLLAYRTKSIENYG
jgi:hypothetical protein